MIKWEYKCVPLDRRGTKEDFSFNWTYGPWELVVDQGGKKPLTGGLDELGRQGWELAAVLPSDLWSEGTRTPNASHGVRSISCTLVFKRPADEKTQRSSTATASAANSAASPAAAPVTQAATATPAVPASPAAPALPATSTPSADSTPAPSTESPVTAAPPTTPPEPKAPSDDPV